MKKKWLIPSLTMAMATTVIPFVSVGCVWNGTPIVVPSSISLNTTSCSLEVGKTKQLEVTIEPAELKPKLVWRSSDPSKVRVNQNGLITAVDVTGGSVTIRVWIDGYEYIHFATCSVMVQPTEPTGITIKEGTEGTITYNPSASMFIRLNAQVYPETASQDVEWYTDDTDVLYHVGSEGDFEVLGPGDAIITVHPLGFPQFTATFTLHVLLERQHFDTCPWAFINQQCNLLSSGDITEEQFCSMFSVYNYDTPDETDYKPATSLTDFIGQPHTVEYPLWRGVGTAVVIGVKQDYMVYNPSTHIFSKPVTFTFEMKTAISRRDSTHYWQWSASTNANYWQSTIYQSGLPEIENMFKQSRDGLFNCIKPVYRTVNTGEPSNFVPTISPKADRFFLLTLSDIVSPKGLDSSGVGGTDLYVQENVRSFRKLDTYQYEYYKKELGDNPIKVDGRPAQYHCLQHSMQYSENLRPNFWIASPYVFNPKGSWWLSNVEGTDEGLCNSVGIGNMCLLAPCFCI